MEDPLTHPRRNNLTDAKWQTVSGTYAGYSWRCFRIQKESDQSYWHVTHDGRELTLLEDLLEAMSYCERVQLRLEE